MAKYYEGRMVEDTLENLIKLEKAGKVKHHPFSSDLSQLVEVCERHARKDLSLAEPWLPEDKEDWEVKDVWDKVLHTDIIVNRGGWLVAIDWTLKSSEMDFKVQKLGRVATALSRLGVDRAVAVLIHQQEDSTTEWVAQLDAVIRTATLGDDFVSDGEIYF